MGTARRGRWSGAVRGCARASGRRSLALEGQSAAPRHRPGRGLGGPDGTGADPVRGAPDRGARRGCGAERPAAVGARAARVPAPGDGHRAPCPGAFAPDRRPGGASSGEELRSRVLAAWTGPDGSRHESPVLVGIDRPDGGDRFAMWTDARGREVARPLDAETATTHAVLAGTGTAVAVAALVEAARRAVVWRLVRRRYARWSRSGSGRGRTGAGPARAVDGLPPPVNSPPVRTLRWTGRTESATTRVRRGGGTATPWHRARSR